MAAKPKEQVTMYKIIVLGDMGVGKTSLLGKYVTGKFDAKYKATIGADLVMKEGLEIAGKKVTLQLWDTAGQERFQSIGTAYYRGAEACIIVFDLTVLESFEHVRTWMDEFIMQAGDHPFILVGNKADCEAQRQVTSKQALQWCSKNRKPGCDPIPYYETTATDGRSVERVFHRLVESLANAPLDSVDDAQSVIKLDASVPRKSSKCSC